MEKFLLLLLFFAQPVLAEECRNWPQWDGFSERYIENGRVIDPSADHHTTSEGQSYALFFSLVANDRKNFDIILKWTETHLGDLVTRLPAWEWGKREDGSNGVLDENSAADSDLWIAYTLAQAGNLWKSPEYSETAKKLSSLILEKESDELPGIGRTLIPGESSFHPEAGFWRLNPSYVPLQIVRGMAAIYPDSQWPDVVSSSIDLIVRSAPLGFAPDWIIYREGKGFQPDSQGSYNAIRVYLWAGRLSQDDPVKKILLERFSPMVQYVEKAGTPPVQVDTRTGNAKGDGPAGFSAALVPLLFSSNAETAMEAQQLRIEANAPLARKDNYYEQALTLFGLGWMENRYRFSGEGALLPNWTCGKS